MITSHSALSISVPSASTKEPNFVKLEYLPFSTVSIKLPVNSDSECLRHGTGYDSKMTMADDCAGEDMFGHRWTRML